MWRHAFHAGNAVVFTLAITTLEHGALLYVFGILLTATVAVDVIRLHDKRANHVFFRFFRYLVSEREMSRPASSTWYLVGVMLCLLIFPTRIVTASILVLGFADPVAAIVGKKWGVRRLGGGTVLGSLSFFCTAALIGVSRLDWPAGIVAALAATLGEAYSFRLDDNVTIPTAFATAAWLVS